MGMLILPKRNYSKNYQGDKQNPFFHKQSYSNKDAVRNVIRDITRTRDNEKYLNHLLGYGALGTMYQLPVEYIIKTFCYIQEEYDIERRKGRRIYHEIFWFSPEELRLLNIERMWNFAYECSRLFFDSGFQVVFAIHSDGVKTHIHFAVNTVNYRTGRKFRSYHQDLKEREIYFNSILQKYLVLPPIPQSPIRFWNDPVYMK